MGRIPHRGSILRHGQEHGSLPLCILSRGTGRSACECKAAIQADPYGAARAARQPGHSRESCARHDAVFEPRLSASHAISCNSCHNIGLGGADAEPTSIGHRWQHGGRNAPTVLNAVFNTAQFWDGRAKDLEQQAGGPIVNPIEMASPEAHVAEQLKGIPGYREFVRQGFSGEADPITLTNAQKAIAVFEATLITPNAPFDRFPRGHDALSPKQKAGWRCSWTRAARAATTASMSAAACTRRSGSSRSPVRSCCRRRQGPLRGHQDPKRRVCLQNPDAPRNIALTAPYFPHGEAWDLRQAVAVMGTSQLGTQLTGDEIDKITAFLDSLTGEQPKVTYPILPPSVGDTPRPQP